MKKKNKNRTQLLLIATIIIVLANVFLNMVLISQPRDYVVGRQVGIARVFVLETVSLTLNVDTVDFGNLNNGDIDDTLDVSPGPFEMENTGNVNIDITIQASDMWTEEPNPSAFFQYQSEENELGTIDTGGSLISSWTNIPATGSPATFATRMKFQAINDLLNGHVGIEVPGDESSGLKESTITFTASLAV